ncbi:hypothetical protein [Azorhizobium doebereinerae]|uniref:hypothetical protein n=1 Tax=Azorhizobium doebereinerae TaxID=281091 RepID=UPI00042A7E89|nr:hypothetical protein [Azorhizobium doebereinerae]
MSADAGLAPPHHAHLDAHLDAHVAAAGRLMSAGRHAEAEILVAEILAQAPEQVDALLLRAAGALARGAAEPAFALLADLAGRHPGRADVIANLGAAHAALGRPEAAVACLEQAALLAPHDGTRRAELAAALLAQDEGARARAEILAVQQLAQAADDAGLMAEGWSLAARLLLREGRPGPAEAALRHALDLRPGHGPDLALISDILAGEGRLEAALACAEEAYLAAPADHGRAVALAGRLMDLGRLEAAERHLRRVIATAPHHPEATDALARVRILAGDTAGGLAAFAALVRRAEGDPGALLAMARLLRLAGELEKALAFAEQAFQRAPDAAEAAHLRTHLLLALGRFGEVWPVPEDGPPAVAALRIPEGLAAGELVLLARFARAVAPAGGAVPCHAEAALLPLLEGIVGLAATAAPAPADALALTALPSLLGSDAGAPGAPYLAVDAARHARWGAALEGLPRPLIGLAFEAGAQGLRLADLAAALAGRGTLVSLAFGPERAQLSACPAVVDAGADFADARDLAAAMAHLDLVAGSAGLALHMAGAMGMRAAALVPAALPWPFAHRDGASLWYPNMRVLPAQRPGDWAAPLAELARMAAATAGNGGEA